MESCPSLARVLRRLIALSVIGAFILLFAGQILTILMMIAVCAGVGFLVWLPLHTAIFGRHSVWRTACAFGQRWRTPVEIHLAAARQRLDDFLEQWVPAVRDAIVETVSGAVVGVLLAVVAETGLSAAILSALIGLAAGLGVSLRRHSRGLGT